MANAPDFAKAAALVLVPEMSEASSRSQSDAAVRVRLALSHHNGFVYRSLRRLGVRPADLDDAVQEVFIVLLRRIDSVPVHQERSFLFGTSVRVASSHRRSARRHPEDPVESLDSHLAPGVSAEDERELRRMREVLQGILDGMSTEQRAVFILCELEEMSVPVAASMLDVPIGTASSRLRSAREVFRMAARRAELKRLQETKS